MDASVKGTAAEEVVRFLNFSRQSDCLSHEFKDFTLSEWKYLLRWLDDAGMAFYFLAKLKQSQSTNAVPSWVLSCLEQNFAANQERVRHMSQAFELLNRKFREAGIRYAALKGFSLIPEFCPDAALRYQGDFDYLIDEDSLEAAEAVLVKSGYCPKASLSSQERIFVTREMAAPSRSGEQYQACAHYAVELHLDMWDANLDRVRLQRKLFLVERATTRQWNGTGFPALADEEAFVLQILHACHHFFDLWIRMSCLFEIAYFVSRRVDDTRLWKRIEDLVGDDLVLRELVVVVTEVAGKLFGSPIPSVVSAWGQRIQPGSRVWIERYALDWAFCEVPVYEFTLFPRAKLVRFLHRQYKDKPRTGKPEPTPLLSPRLSRFALSLRKRPSLVLDAHWWKRRVQVRIFHILAGLRYFCEVPRWLWLNRANAVHPLRPRS